MPSTPERAEIPFNGHVDQLHRHWQQQNTNCTDDCFTYTVLENHFGHGFGFLSTWNAWLNSEFTFPQEREQRKQHLHYIAVEHHPFTTSELRIALNQWPEIQVFSDALIKNYPPHARLGSTHRIEFKSNSSNTNKALTLTLIFDGFHEALCELTQEPSKNHPLSGTGLTSAPPHIDTWLLHDELISNQHDAWQESIYAGIALNSRRSTQALVNTTINTSSKHQSESFKHLRNIGFYSDSTYEESRCDDLNGNLSCFQRGDRLESNRLESDRTQITPTENGQYEFAKKFTPWLHIKRGAPLTKKTAIVIGAGLAGAQTAFALAERGYSVTVIDKKTIASGASSNLQGAVYTKLSSGNNDLTKFNLAAQSFADRFYNSHGFFQNCGQKSGVFHLAINEKMARNYQEVAGEVQQHMGPDTELWAQWIEAQDTKHVTGLELSNGGIFLPNTGWLQPELLCQSLLGHPSIQVREHTHITQIVRDHESNEWLAFEESTLVSRAEICVICNAADARKFEQTQFLQLKNIRGQVSHIQCNAPLQQLKTVICGKGYIAPPVQIEEDTVHCIGATFNLNNDSVELSTSDHQLNLSMLASISNRLNATDLELVDGLSTSIPGKVGFRCTTPDYFPIVGPVPIQQEFCEIYADLGRNAKSEINTPAACHTNLFCNIGYGSRGLAYSPISARLLVSIIAGDHLPVAESLYKHLHPARFLIRDIIRNKL